MRHTGPGTQLQTKESVMSDNAGAPSWREAASGASRSCCATARASSPPGSDTPGGENDNPTYRNHPGHAEAVEIVFDPERISYRDILEFFFRSTTRRPRTARATTSALVTARDLLQRTRAPVARGHIADVDASGLWPGKAVTEISDAVPFWAAEAEHQDYLQRYPNGYTCHFPRPGWKLPHREAAA